MSVLPFVLNRGDGLAHVLLRCTSSRSKGQTRHIYRLLRFTHEFETAQCQFRKMLRHVTTKSSPGMHNQWSRPWKQACTPGCVS